MNLTEVILIMAVIVIWLAFRRHKKIKAALPKEWLARHQAGQEARKAEMNKLARQSRITTASFTFRILIYFTLTFAIYALLADFFGWPGHERFKLRIAPGHLYDSPADMPPEIRSIWMVQAGLSIWAMVVLSCLFHLYEKGIFFAAKNVNFIRFFGYYMIINWVLDYQIQGQLRDLELSSTPLFGAFLIIFIAWIMDEGRKIQEEQALTV